MSRYLFGYPSAASARAEKIRLELIQEERERAGETINSQKKRTGETINSQKKRTGETINSQKKSRVLLVNLIDYIIPSLYLILPIMTSLLELGYIGNSIKTLGGSGSEEKALTPKIQDEIVQQVTKLIQSRPDHETLGNFMATKPLAMVNEIIRPEEVDHVNQQISELNEKNEKINQNTELTINEFRTQNALVTQELSQAISHRTDLIHQRERLAQMVLNQSVSVYIALAQEMGLEHRHNEVTALERAKLNQRKEQFEKQIVLSREQLQNAQEATNALQKSAEAQKHQVEQLEEQNKTLRDQVDATHKATKDFREQAEAQLKLNQKKLETAEAMLEMKEQLLNQAATNAQEKALQTQKLIDIHKKSIEISKKQLEEAQKSNLIREQEQVHRHRLEMFQSIKELLYYGLIFTILLLITLFESLRNAVATVVIGIGTSFVASNALALIILSMLTISLLPKLLQQLKPSFMKYIF